MPASRQRDRQRICAGEHQLNSRGNIEIVRRAAINREHVRTRRIQSHRAGERAGILKLQVSDRLRRHVDNRRPGCDVAVKNQFIGSRGRSRIRPYRRPVGGNDPALVRAADPRIRAVAGVGECPAGVGSAWRAIRAAVDNDLQRQRRRAGNLLMIHSHVRHRESARARPCALCAV